MCYRNLIIMPIDVEFAGETKWHRLRYGEACILDPSFVEPLDGSIKCLPQIQGMSGKYPAILNISKTGRVALM